MCCVQPTLEPTLASSRTLAACLHQWPRDNDQNKLFRQGLDAMAFGYASPMGTTVLRCEWMPPQPAEYVGVVCIFPDSVALGARHTTKAAPVASGLPVIDQGDVTPGTGVTEDLRRRLEASGREIVSMVIWDGVSNEWDLLWPAAWPMLDHALDILNCAGVGE